MPTLKMSESDWNFIRNKIQSDFKPAVSLLRTAMARELGFTVRRHEYWVQEDGTGSYDGYGEYKTEIHLDFVNSAAETYFRLKYL